MLELKPRDQLNQPEMISRIRGRSLAQLHDIVSGITLNDTAPENVQRQFNIARHAFIYAWYCHDFHAVASLYGFLAIELALSHRVKAVQPSLFEGGRKPTLYPLLRVAVLERWIIDGGFQIENQATLEIPEKIAARFPTIPEDQRYCYMLLDVLPELRNGAAHGNYSVTLGVSHELARASELINQLYPAQS